jgi:molybdopterin-binding protein
VEGLGHRVRLLTGPPLPVAVEVTVEARDELGLAPGSEIWLALKATEIGVEPDTETRGSAP